MPGENLTAQDVVECTAGFGEWVRQRAAGGRPRIVIGRDARISGPWMQSLVVQTLLSMGIDVTDLGLSTTPTVEMAVPREGADAGIILTASHNPREWNALKFLNRQGEFISAADGAEILAIIAQGNQAYAPLDRFGRYEQQADALAHHLAAILGHPLVRAEQVQAQRYKVVVDAVNSSGAISVPPLLEALGCEVILLNGEPHGDFAHNPEPLPEHLTELSARVVAEGAAMGIAVDPDVDRLAFVCENGEAFGEEYTLVAVADYVLRHRPGNTVSNLSSTRALRDVTHRHGGSYHASAVGEVNVVRKMKEGSAVIGGEGNGGIIVPELHYGRDALAGVALFLSHLAMEGTTLSALKAGYPAYHMVKDKVSLSPSADLAALLESLNRQYRHESCDTTDGLKIDFDHGWVHLRRSNTEPIVRIYSESRTREAAEALVAQIRADVLAMV
ncbi:MAG: hypothetical protein RLY31_1414 [Bacteroidota bacterium]